MTVNFSIEDKFRCWAFHQYYRAYCLERNPSHRFIRAIVELSKPIAENRILIWEAAKKEIDLIDKKFKTYKITRNEWTKQIRAAIRAHTGATGLPRAWERQAV